MALLACLHVTLVADELRGAGLGWVGLAAGALMLAGSLVGAAAWGARAARRMAPLAWVLAAVDALALVAIARITVSVDPSATLAWAFVLWVPFSIAARARASSALLGTAAVAALVLSAALMDVGALRALPHTWGAVGVPA
ncbi:MAG: hypothetical protein JWM98_37, partial [Thermoleophilia bacterium]|nr:hypothetical protein [Thermoleophilia bacterium]